MTPVGSPSFSQLWRVVLTTPSGYPEVVEVQAPSEQIALDRIAHWRPEWTIREISRRPTEGRA